MKTAIISIIATLLVLLFLVQMGWLMPFGINRFSITTTKEDADNSNETFDSVTDSATGVSYRVKTEGDYFYVYTNGEWAQKFWKGVNIGAGEPGIFPGELTISYETYFRWFGYISEMNANCIRVYTTMSPQFYKALDDFNKQSENPIMLFQGIWMNEEDIQRLSDVYAENNKILNDFKASAYELINVIHGNAVIPQRPGLASGTYVTNVSKWFAGWMVGIEWEPAFVKNTNDVNPWLNTFDGEYLYTQAATPFEAFLCQIGNDMIKYETEKYKFQSPLAFTNWITTDPLTHPDEPHYDEDSVTVNMENIKSRSPYICNMFASYHIYPYYPDSLNYQQDYLAYVDDTGKANPYEAYLRDLKLAHTMPIMVAEFGIPTSRGLGHESIMGYNQGKVDETKQGDMILDMFRSIFEENYAGGLLFTWQDEWFKRTWNNVNFDIADRRPFWSNIQTTEQCFGLLSFDPGQDACKVYVDGDIKDWQGMKPVTETEQCKLYVNSDERYLYLMFDGQTYDFENDTLFIPINTISGQGNDRMNDTGVTFDSYADFVIRINGKSNSRILVDSYYDAFYYLYGEQYKMLPLNAAVKTKNSGNFNKMSMCYGYELVVPTTKELVPFKSYETGLLQYGNANPTDSEYMSLSDFCYNNGCLEIRIPWQLLNVMDPSEKKNMDDFYSLQIFSPAEYDNFYFGFGVAKDPKESMKIEINGSYSYDKWTFPTYHERLKPAYYELQEGLKKYND